MSVLLRYLQESVEQQKLLSPQQQKSFVESFLSDQPHQQRVERLTLGHESSVIQEAIEWLLLEDGFLVGGGADFSRGVLTAKLEETHNRNQGWLARVPFHREQLHFTFEVRIKVFRNGMVVLNASRNLASWFTRLRSRLEEFLSTTPPRVDEVARRAADKLHGEETLENIILAPGKPLQRAFTGNLRDYSGCAEDWELEDLSRKEDDKPDEKVLPLGRYRFDRREQTKGEGKEEGTQEGDVEGAGESSISGPLLYLGRYKTGARMEYNGTLVVAPQNSGKTKLIVRWALAANRAGYSSFVVDVKGNLMEKLREENTPLQGKVYHFSTDPNLHPPAIDRLNFLAGLQGLTAADRKVIEQLVDALLPQEGWESGDNLYFRQLWSRWLRAFIQVLKLFECYFLDTESEVFDLSDLYRLASTESLLYEFLKQIKGREAELLDQGKTPLSPRIDYWITELAQLIAPDAEDLPGGQRESRYTYQSLTVGILASLRPFSESGTLCDRIRGKGDFALEELDGDEQVTIVLAARAQDLDDSVTVVTLAMKRLQQILFERMNRAKAKPILLLLDETRRIRGFKSGEYITFAREAKAGCVLVYQSITQIRNEQEITEILENVGTQIYLGSLAGETARRFVDILPKRYRRSFSQSTSYSGKGGVGGNWDERQDLVDYFTTQDLYRLPAGEWPALVYIKDHASRKPFLVDMSEPESKSAR